MHVRLASRPTPKPIRAIYNAEVIGSTATFDLVPRTPEEQLAWMAEHRAPTRPSWRSTTTTVARVRLPLGLPRPAGLRHHRRGLGLRRTRPTGAGVGRALLEELVGLATQHGFHSVIARIGGDNEASIALHQACGFDAGRRRAGGRPQVQPLAGRRRSSSGCSEPARSRPAGAAQAGRPARRPRASPRRRPARRPPGRTGRSQAVSGTVRTTRIHSRVSTICSGSPWMQARRSAGSARAAR